MKFIILTLIAITSVLNAQSFNNITGTWYITSPKEYKSVSFANDRNGERGGKLTLEFNREGKIRVNESGKIYAYRVKSGKLQIAKDRRQFDLKRKNRWDIIKVIGRLDNGCLHVKYEKKGLGGYSARDGYKMCKIEDMPKPTYVREPYKF